MRKRNLTCDALEEVVVEPLLGIHGDFLKDELMGGCPRVVRKDWSLCFGIHDNG